MQTFFETWLETRIQLTRLLKKECVDWEEINLLLVLGDRTLSTRDVSNEMEVDYGICWRILKKLEKDGLVTRDESKRYVATDDCSRLIARLTLSKELREHLRVFAKAILKSIPQ